MEGLIVLGILVVFGYSLYRSGKRIGSRKGYNVGRLRAGGDAVRTKTVQSQYEAS